MPITLSALSLSRLHGVHPNMIRVVRRAAAIAPFDFMVVVEGLRTKERQDTLYAQGRTKPGKIVTWTMASKHLQQPDGFGHAVDLCVVDDNGNLDWTKCDALAMIVLRAAKDLNVAIRWGADWDGDGKPHEKGETDGPHFELKG